MKSFKLYRNPFLLLILVLIPGFFFSQVSTLSISHQEGSGTSYLGCERLKEFNPPTMPKELKNGSDTFNEMQQGINEKTKASELIHDSTVPITLNSSVTNSSFGIWAPPYGHTVVGLRMNESESLNASLILSTNSSNFDLPYLINETNAHNVSSLAWVAVEGRSLSSYLNITAFLNRTEGIGQCWLEMENFTRSIVLNQPLDDGLGLFRNQEIMDVYEFYVDTNLYYNVTFKPDEYAVALDIDLYIVKGNSTSHKPLFMGTTGGVGMNEELLSLQFNESGYYALIAMRKNGSGFYNYQVQSYSLINGDLVIALTDGGAYQGMLDTPTGKGKAYFLVPVDPSDFSTIVVYASTLDLNLKVFFDPDLASLFMLSNISGSGKLESVVYDGRDPLLHTVDYLFVEVSTSWATEVGQFIIEYSEAYDIIGQGTLLNATLTSGQHSFLLEWRTSGDFDYDACMWSDNISAINFYFFDGCANIVSASRTGTLIEEFNASYIVGIEGLGLDQYLAVLATTETVPCKLSLKVGPHDLLPPDIISVETIPDIIMYGEIGQVAVHMTDFQGLGIAAVNMSYRLYDSDTWTLISMNRSTTDLDTFSASFSDTFSYGDLVLVFFEFIDYADNQGSAFSVGNYYTIEINDLVPPLISNISISPENPTMNDPVTVTAIIEEPPEAAGLSNATIWYSIDFGTSWNEIAMQWDEETTLATGTIPQLGVGTTVIFFINATDTIGNQGTNDNNGGMYGYTVGIGLFGLNELLLLIGGSAVIGGAVIAGAFGIRRLRKRRALQE
ncbi:MAG: hypothetical protein ACFE9L_21640 [Candidatus Hodarchaeota archaeon]